MTRDQRLTRLEDHVMDLRDKQSMLAQQLTEIQLRVRFCMEAMRMVNREKPASLLVDGDGKKKLDLVSGYYAYTFQGGRDETLATVEKEYAEFQALQEKAEADIHAIETQRALDAGEPDPHAPSDAEPAEPVAGRHRRGPRRLTEPKASHTTH
jgi:septal ring factor EnvC (AmiA/AmiB activator)